MGRRRLVYQAIRGPEIHAYSAQSVNQDPSQTACTETQTPNIWQFTSSFFFFFFLPSLFLPEMAHNQVCYLFWPVSQQRISLVCSESEDFSLLCFSERDAEIPVGKLVKKKNKKWCHRSSWNWGLLKVTNSIFCNTKNQENLACCCESPFSTDRKGFVLGCKRGQH